MSLENEEINNVVPDHSCNKIYLLLLRFYFIFFPMYPLLSKFVGTSLWKDALYIFFCFIGFNVFIKNKFLIWYFLGLFLTILFQVVQGYDYFEYLTWFLMGPPLYLYFRYISAESFKTDLFILMGIMLAGFIFVFFYEIPARDSMFFEIDGEKGSSGFFLRGDDVRARFSFVSPMAFSQYSWFIALTILFNKNISKMIRIIFTVLMLISIFYCNTRAGVFLTIITVGVYFYTKFNLHKIKIYNFLVVVAISVIVIFKNVISGQTANHDNETMSDGLRMILLLDGIDKAKESFLLGVSGNFFSPRAEDWYDFENSWLSLIVCFGMVGIFLLILLFNKLIFTTNNKYLMFYIIPWMAYSSIFPVLQEPTAVFITWVIIVAVLNIDKWNELNGNEPDENEDEDHLITETV
ncbi:MULTISPECIES: O-antigen ligase family protein [Chryseobacterium]|uniref:O-antigen ligase family protein n=1 Tax=Chryseobacterium TaxID=59732 RepID=UPI0011AED91A|nr:MULTISPECIES: O-antigen ligase family protein [Chryseobacterium]